MQGWGMRKGSLAPLSLVQRNEENWAHLAVAAWASAVARGHRTSVFEHKLLHLEVVRSKVSLYRGSYHSLLDHT